MNLNSASTRGAVYGILAASIWGGMYVVSDVVLRVIPPFTLLSLRLMIGVLILGLILKRDRQAALPWADAMKLLGVGVVGYGISLGAQNLGTKLASAANAGAINGAVVTSASPAFILLFAWLILREPLTPIRIAAVILASIGVLATLDLEHFDLSSNSFMGNVVLGIAALTWGLYSVLVRRVSKDYPTLTISLYALLGGMLLAVPAAALELRVPFELAQPVGDIIVPLILGVLYLGVISTALAMFLWNEAFALVEASIASLFFFAQPLVGVLLATVLLHQAITPRLLLGGLLIILGVALSMFRTTPAPAAEQV